MLDIGRERLLRVWAGRIWPAAAGRDGESRQIESAALRESGVHPTVPGADRPRFYQQHQP